MGVLSCGVLAMALFAGCSENKLTRENYDLIVVNSSNKDEVMSCLGDKHLNDHAEMRAWEYEDMDRKLSVWFWFDDQGVVTRKQWNSGAGGFEHDSQEMPAGEVRSRKDYRSTTDR
jgi:hypothetical protein